MAVGAHSSYIYMLICMYRHHATIDKSLLFLTQEVLVIEWSASRSLMIKPPTANEDYQMRDLVDGNTFNLGATACLGSRRRIMLCCPVSSE